MAKRKWETIFSGVQAISAVAVAGLAFWAFFFSPLSQKIEDHLRTEATLAKLDLIAAREAKAHIEGTRDKLRSELTTLEQKIAAATDETSRLLQERTAYAASTKSLAYSRYSVMVTYELAIMRKVAAICADYGKHRRWLTVRREFAKLEKEWEQLPSGQQFNEALPINKRMNELREERYRSNDIWFGVPRRPSIGPSGGSNVVFTDQEMKLWNPNNHEEQNTYAVSWLLDQISVARGASQQTGASFVARTKGYSFLDQLLPKEREELNSQIDRFLEANIRYASMQLNVIVPDEPSPNDIIASGKKTLPDIKEFQQAFVAHLRAVGIGDGGSRQGE